MPKRLTFYEVRGYVHAQDRVGYVRARFYYIADANAFVQLVLENKGQGTEQHEVHKTERSYL